MRGHWIGGGLRKLNKHYQGASGGSKTWNGDGNLVPVDCVFAPFYGVFSNGQFLSRTDVNTLTGWQQSADPDLEYVKIDVDVKPYIPRVSDSYYDWDPSSGVQAPLQWIAHQNGCVVRRWDIDNLNYTDIINIGAGTDFSSEQFDLIKPEYDYYIFRGLFSTIGYQKNIKTAYDALSSGYITYNFKAQRVASQVVSPRSYLGLYGLFGEEPKGSASQYNTTALLSPMFMQYAGKEFDNNSSQVVTGGTPPTSPTSQVPWAGIQYPSIWHTGGINQMAIPYNQHNLPGFKYNNNDVTAFLRSNNGTSQYSYAQVFILKKLTKERGTIVG